MATRYSFPTVKSALAPGAIVNAVTAAAKTPMGKAKSTVPVFREAIGISE